MSKKETLLGILEGQEVISTEFEGCVGIINGEVVYYGEVVCSKPTIKQLEVLVLDLADYELGPDWEAQIIREFANA